MRYKKKNQINEKLEEEHQLEKAEKPVTIS